MLPVDFPGSNMTLNVQPGSRVKMDLVYQDVPAFHGRDAEGLPFFLTCWRPSKEDIDSIINGGMVYVKVTGFETPPVVIFTTGENNKPNYVE